MCDAGTDMRSFLSYTLANSEGHSKARYRIAHPCGILVSVSNGNVTKLPRQCRRDIRLQEVIADEQQSAACRHGERISETIAKVQSGRMQALAPSVAQRPSICSIAATALASGSPNTMLINADVSTTIIAACRRHRSENPDCAPRRDLAIASCWRRPEGTQSVLRAPALRRKPAEASAKRRPDRVA